jgi:hypothetical protein
MPDSGMILIYLLRSIAVILFYPRQHRSELHWLQHGVLPGVGRSGRVAKAAQPDEPRARLPQQPSHLHHRVHHRGGA